MSRWIALSLMLSVSPGCGGQAQLGHIVGGKSYIEQIYALGQGKVSSTRIAAAAEDFVARNRGKYHLAVLWLVADDSDLISVKGVLATDEIYEGWRREWITNSRRDLKVGRVTIIGKNAVLQTRLDNTHTTTEVLGEVNPLELSIQESKFTIATALGRNVTDPQMEFSSSCKVSYDVYLHGNPVITPGIEKRLWMQLSALLGSPCVSFTVRKDFWFRGAGVPPMFPFSPMTEPPGSLGESESGLILRCYAFDTGLSCLIRTKEGDVNTRYRESELR